MRNSADIFSFLELPVPFYHDLYYIF